jgi:hypothetical protein
MHQPISPEAKRAVERAAQRVAEWAAKQESAKKKPTAPRPAKRKPILAQRVVEPPLRNTARAPMLLIPQLPKTVRMMLTPQNSPSH